MFYFRTKGLVKLTLEIFRYYIEEIKGVSNNGLSIRFRYWEHLE